MRPILIVLWFLLLTACSAAVDQATPTPAPSTPLPTTLPTLPPATSTPFFPPATDTETTQPDPTSAPTQPLPAPTETAAVTAPATSPPAAVPDQFPDASAYTWKPIASGLSAPIGLANAGDGSGRLFVLEQAGVIRVIQNGALLDMPFLDIRDRVGSQGSEQGLLGLAFHPRYTENGFFFVNYTKQNGDTAIARFRVSQDDPGRADRDSETRLLQISQPNRNHNGGATAFGPDGYLYLGLGDGGGAGDPQDNAQNLNTLLGKILRIDVDQGELYAIPPGNPFANGGGQPEIWAYGLRNPWRFAFDRQTGDLYIGDVGQGSFEEVDFQPATSQGGENYGWDIMEGQECFNRSNCDSAGLTLPVSVYPTHSAGSCSITGGNVYRGSLAEWQGVYLFGDYCSGRVWGLRRNAQGEWEQSLLFEDIGRITSFGEDELGDVYVVDHTGNIFQLAEK